MNRNPFQTDNANFMRQTPVPTDNTV